MKRTQISEGRGIICTDFKLNVGLEIIAVISGIKTK